MNFILLIFQYSNKFIEAFDDMLVSEIMHKRLNTLDVYKHKFILFSMTSGLRRSWLYTTLLINPVRVLKSNNKDNEITLKYKRTFHGRRWT